MYREQITAKISKKALIPVYFSIPAFYFLPSGITALIIGLKQKAKQAAADAALKAIGAPDINEVTGEISSAVFGEVTDGVRQATSTVGQVFKGIFIFFSALVALVWFIWCIVMTARHFKNSLTIDGDDVACSAKRQKFFTTLDKIDNVFVEQSLWGKLFDYGNITIAAQNGSITVYNIADPKSLDAVLKSKIN